MDVPTDAQRYSHIKILETKKNLKMYKLFIHLFLIPFQVLQLESDPATMGLRRSRPI